MTTRAYIIVCRRCCAPYTICHSPFRIQPLRAELCDLIGFHGCLVIGCGFSSHWKLTDQPSTFFHWVMRCVNWPVLTAFTFACGSRSYAQIFTGTTRMAAIVAHTSDKGACWRLTWFVKSVILKSERSAFVSVLPSCCSIAMDDNANRQRNESQPDVMCIAVLWSLPALLFSG